VAGRILCLALVYQLGLGISNQMEGFPSHAAAHWRLGIIFEHKQDIDSAKNEYETALKLDPDYKLAKEALEKLTKK